MKIFLKLLAIINLCGVSYMATADELKITVTNIKADQGTLYLRIYDTNSQWLSQEKDGPRVTEIISLEKHKGATEITKTFDLPEGTYAVTTLQDVNNNGVMDRNGFGVPQEPVGGSGSSEKKNGPPTFEDSKFELKGKMEKSLMLIHY